MSNCQHRGTLNTESIWLSEAVCTWCSAVVPNPAYYDIDKIAQDIRLTYVDVSSDDWVLGSWQSAEDVFDKWLARIKQRAFDEGYSAANEARWDNE